jgi:hypothetical protein
MLRNSAMLWVFRHILVLLVAVALVGETTSEVARSAQYGLIKIGDIASSDMTMSSHPGDPSDMVMSSSVSSDIDAEPMLPCKGMTPDCIKLMGCVTTTALPAHFVEYNFTCGYGTVDYWTYASEHVGIHHRPDPFPPRTV